MLRRALLGVSRSSQVKSVVTRLPVTSGIVSRFIAGESTEDAVVASNQLISAGLSVSVDHLAEDTFDIGQAETVTTAYLDLLSKLRESGLTRSAEVSLKLSAIGQSLGADGVKIALGHAQLICAAARNAGTTVTLDMEDHTTTDATLETLAELRKDFPDTGAVLQAYLHRTEADCRDLAVAGSRVRLCKGAYKEPASVAFQDQSEVDKAYVRACKILMNGAGYPMIASHDPRLIAIAAELARIADRSLDTYEFQMLYGIRPAEQQRLANHGHRVRVYVPYGSDWYGYVIRRLAERPANLTFFARSLLTKG